MDSDQTALAAVQPSRVLHADAVMVRARVNLIQEVMQTSMKQDVHYGVIPGCKKPSLYKAGAEKLMMTFALAAADPTIEDLSTDDAIRYRVHVPIQTQAASTLLAVGMGECSSDEEKYRWRKPVCDEEYNEAPEHLRREVWKSGKRGPYKVKQVRMRPADVANTVLAMAYKRALVAGVRLATAASDVFEQGIEDLPDGYEMTDSDGGAQTVPMPTAKPPDPTPAPSPTDSEPQPSPTPADSAPGTLGVVAARFSGSQSSEKDGDGKPKWRKYTVKLTDGRVLSTFSETVFSAAEEAARTGQAVFVVTKPAKNPKYPDSIESMTLIEDGAVPGDESDA